MLTKRQEKKFLKIMAFLKQNKPELFYFLIISFCLFVLFFFFIKLFCFFQQINKIKERKEHNFYLTCSLRGDLATKKYDTNGEYTEEFWRIQLIDSLLKKGIKKEWLFLEYPIFFGHKGKNSLRVDLAVKKKSTFLLVAEIKKTYTVSGKKSAIQHQLIPAMRLLNCNLGIYYDGTENNCFIIKNNDDEFIFKNFDFFWNSYAFKKLMFV